MKNHQLYIKSTTLEVKYIKLLQLQLLQIKLFYLVAVRESEGFNNTDFRPFLKEERDVDNLSDSGKLFHKNHIKTIYSTIAKRAL